MLELLSEMFDGLVKYDGWDDCVVGVIEKYGQDTVLCYDREKILDRLAEIMEYDDAVEYFEVNILSLWAGDRTPCFLFRPEINPE